MVLDEHGGPNHVGNYCSAPIHIDTVHDALMRQSSYFYIGHFSRFALPGASRILCSASGSALEATSFLNQDNSIATVVIPMRRSHSES